MTQETFHKTFKEKYLEATKEPQLSAKEEWEKARIVISNHIKELVTLENTDVSHADILKDIERGMEQLVVFTISCVLYVLNPTPLPEPFNDGVIGIILSEITSSGIVS